MATLDTQIIDDIIVKSRRKMLTLGGTALAGLMVGGATPKANAATVAYTDNDILNFALNLEYLEANFYYLCAFGCLINAPNSAAMAAGAPTGGIPITITGGGVGTAGTVNSTGFTAGGVPWGTGNTAIQVGSYATETAIEEGKHVLALQAALGSVAVNQPQINLAATGTGAIWPALATAADVAGGSGFNPYANIPFFLVGAYVFEDVGVSAYHGAASLLTGTTTTLPVAAGILAVESYHAGLVRTTINYVDPANAATYLTITSQVSALRAALSLAAAPETLTAGAAVPINDTNPDDYGLLATTTGAFVGVNGTQSTPFQVSLAGAAAVNATRIVDADAVNSIAFARNTTQVLNIVTAGGAVSSSKTVISPAVGGFFPAGLNAGTNGFK
jgi:hypothetical protein